MALTFTSFGIIMWEIAARRTPYDGNVRFDLTNRLGVDDLTHAVALEDYRPDVSLVDSTFPERYTELMARAWNPDPSVRPSFQKLLRKLRRLEDSSVQPFVGPMFDINSNASLRHFMAVALAKTGSEDSGLAIGHSSILQSERFAGAISRVQRLESLRRPLLDQTADDAV